MLSRRGFLKVMGAAAVGAAVFDTASGLWVPGQAEATIVPSTAVSEQLELNEIAKQFAARMADRLEGFTAIGLREVAYRLGGTVGDQALAFASAHATQPHLLAIDGEAGRFRPSPTRMALPLGVPGPQGLSAFVDHAVAGMYGEAQRLRQGVDIFAPIGAQLRPGSSFDDDMMIALARDEESGLCVRVLRYTHDGFRDKTRRTMFELAGGTWQRMGPAAVRRALGRGAQLDEGQEWMLGED